MPSRDFDIVDIVLKNIVSSFHAEIDVLKKEIEKLKQDLKARL